MTESESSEPRKTLRDHLSALGKAFLIVATTLLLLEGLLRLTDPWGLFYFNDLLHFGNDLAVPDAERHYILPDGAHRFAYWQATIAEGTRLIPGTNPDADCTLVLLGDSVMFGYGVNDDETAAHFLAQRFPQVHFVNAAMIGYNSENVLANYRAFPDGDRYLYLIIGNDLDPTLSADGEMFVSGGNERLPHLVRYVQFMIYDQNVINTGSDQHVGQEDSVQMNYLLQDIDALMAAGDVWLVTFDFYVTLIGLIEARGHDVAAIPYPSVTISVVDAHPNADGNRELAESLAPEVEALVAESCDDG